MNKLKDLLSELKDFELLNLYKFRHKTFMDHSKQMIIEEIKKRDLSLRNIESYTPSQLIINRHLKKEKTTCPHCHSSSFYSNTNKEIIELDLETIDNPVHTYQTNFKTCFICLHSEEADEHKKDRKKGRNIFGFFKFIKKYR